MREVEIDYTNWRSERRIRRIQPIGISFESTEWHPHPQWLLHAFDIEDDRALKMFSMATIHSWKAMKESSHGGT